MQAMPHSQSAFVEPTTRSNRDTTYTTFTQSEGGVATIIPKPVIPPQGFVSIDDLVSEWEARPDSDLRSARRWVRDTFYARDGETLRTLRLERGFSQAQLAEILDTSQSHIARIERGTQNIAIQTARKLAKALGVDLTRLDAALECQERIAAESNT